MAKPIDSASIQWLVPGARRVVVPERGRGDFDPYVPLATAWVKALSAQTVVELGVRLGVSARAFLAGAHATGGKVWGIDLFEQHGIGDPAFVFIKADAAEVAQRWESIDLLHIDTDPHTEEQTRRWFDLYAERCRAIALHDTHHPDFGVGKALCDFVASGEWRVFEYWGNPSGWSVLVRSDEKNLREELIP